MLATLQPARHHKAASPSGRLSRRSLSSPCYPNFISTFFPLGAAYSSRPRNMAADSNHLQPPAAAVELILPDYYHSLGNDELLRSIRNLDDPKEFQRLQADVLRPNSRNFFVDFGDDHAWCAFDLSDVALKALMSKPVGLSRLPIPGPLHFVVPSIPCQLTNDVLRDPQVFTEDGCS